MIEPLEAVRVEKLKSIEALGYNPYPTDYRYTHTIAQVVETFHDKSAEELEKDPVTVRVAGRILASRPFGKAGFLVLSDGGARLQVYAKKDQLPERDFQLYQLLDIADF